MAYATSQNTGMQTKKTTQSRFPETWKKAFLLEIVLNGQTQEIFTFSLPPENVEITYPQRVSETKTFGGLFVDDYGAEVAKIVLSGITGNQEARTIYRANLGDLKLSGKDEIFYIRDHIIRYKENNSDYGNTHLYLYNLSAVNEEDIKNNNYKANTDSWEVVLKDFRITQSKERPFWYSYSVEFTGLRILGTKPKNNTTAVAQQAVYYKQADASLANTDKKLAILENPEDTIMVGSGAIDESSLTSVYDAADSLPANYYPNLPPEERVKLAVAELNDGYKMDVIASDMESVQLAGNQIDLREIRTLGETATKVNGKLTKVANARADSKSIFQKAGIFLQNSYRWSTQISAPVKKLRRSITNLRSQINTYRNLISGTIKDTLFSLPMQAIGMARDIESLGVGLVTAPADIALDILGGFRSLRKNTESLVRETKNMPTFIGSRYQKVANMFNNEIESVIHDGESVVNTVAANSKKISMTPDIVVVPAAQGTKNINQPSTGAQEAGTQGADIQVAVINGYDHVAATETTTLEKLAADYLGNPDDAMLIAVVNGITDDSQITPGMDIKIPSKDPNVVATGNEVYSRDDNFGKDIALADDGGITLSAAGDVSVISGDANVGQAIQSRLSESIGNRIRLTVYGIKSGAGQPLLRLCHIFPRP
jgi:hypothetical protein